MELQQIDHTKRSRARRIAALKIYSGTILPEAQNPESQILYWIEHSKSKMTDQFRCFSIESDDGDVVGYLQYSYFSQEEILFFEYLCLNSGVRSLALSPALGAIRSHIANNYPHAVKIVFEVARRKSGETWLRDKRLISYFERLGFRRVDFEYKYPILQNYGGATSYPADLMVNLSGGRTEISQLELRNILRCIYFKHYLNWDKPFLEASSFAHRERLIDSLYIDQVVNIDKNDKFPTIGDDRRSVFRNFIRTAQPIAPLIAHIFGPRLPRLFVIGLLTVWLEKELGSVWLLIPFLVAASAFYCLAEDTASSRKLFSAILLRFSLKPRSS